MGSWGCLTLKMLGYMEISKARCQSQLWSNVIYKIGVMNGLLLTMIWSEIAREIHQGTRIAAERRLYDDKPDSFRDAIPEESIPSNHTGAQNNRARSLVCTQLRRILYGMNAIWDKKFCGRTNSCTTWTFHYHNYQRSCSITPCSYTVTSNGIRNSRWEIVCLLLRQRLKCRHAQSCQNGSFTSTTSVPFLVFLHVRRYIHMLTNLERHSHGAVQT